MSLDEKEQQQTLSWEDRVERLEVKKQLSLVHGSLDIYWHQRAKQHWLVDGDATPSFSIRWQIEGESLILFTKLKWMVSALQMLPR